jgi:polyphosphate kinase
MSHETNYFDRELSWLEFNQRVLNEALDPDIPLLERLKFLAITGSNLDEFFRVRIGGLKTQIKEGTSRSEDPLASGEELPHVPALGPFGTAPETQLQAIRARVERMVADQYACYLTEIAPQLAEQGVQRLLPDQLNATQQMLVRQAFEREILSVLTPMAIEEEGIFPLLPNQMLNVCVRITEDGGEPEERPRSQTGRDDSGEASGQVDNLSCETERFAVIPFGRTLSRFFSLPSERGLSYMLLEDVVAMLIGQFFPGQQVEECVPFRITRNAEVEFHELSPHGLAGNMANVLRARMTAECVRLEVDQRASEQVVAFLQQRLDVETEEIYRLPGPLDLGGFMQLAERRGFESLKYEPWPPVDSPDVPSEELMFDILTARDVLLAHPYQSFDPVVRLVDEAADDPDVIAIKQTLYRISRESPIIQALSRAVENGKHVTVLLELKARFDEERNLKQARELEAIGAQVIHGVKGLKTHAKVCIVVRREPHGIQRYVHFGTGNYNEKTARLYSDVSLMTSDEDLGSDAVAFFNAISGYSQPPQAYRKLESAPLRLRDTLREMIDAEAERSREGQPAKIMLKLNALSDKTLIDALYAASQAGVKVLLNIRGICCLKPGVPDLSENIRVVSIVDRFLEHARLLYFHHGGTPKLFLSSADWMPRNLDHRKELLVPVEAPDCHSQLLAMLHAYFRDNVKGSLLLPDGSYARLPQEGEPFRVQERLYQQAREAVRKAEQRRRTQFEPHRPG